MSLTTTIFQVLILSVTLWIFALAAPPLALPSPLPSLSSGIEQGINASFPHNSILQESQSTLPHLPHNHFYFPIPASDEQLKFWDYGSLLPQSAVLGILQAAQRDVGVNIKAGVPMGKKALHYENETGNVRMLIHVKDRTMTWEVFGTVILGLKIWFEQWDFVECDFDIGQIGMENLFGTGVFVGLDRGVGVDSS